MQKVLTLFFLISVFANCNAQSTKYFRHILMNHMTPRMELRGLHPISQVTADDVSHYIFTYNGEGRVVRVINSHPESRDSHPLGDLGVKRVEIEYVDNTEIRTYFDENGLQTQNLRKVAKEVYSFDSEGFKTGLKYFDEKGQAVESGWGIAEYIWSKHEDKVFETRFDIKGEAQVLAPFFTLGSTMIEYNEQGLIISQYMVDANFKPVAHSSGMASYHDFHDQYGSVVLILYRDIDGNLINAADGEYATILMLRDQFGNVLESLGMQQLGSITWHNIHKYDAKGNRL